MKHRILSLKLLVKLFCIVLIFIDCKVHNQSNMNYESLGGNWSSCTDNGEYIEIYVEDSTIIFCTFDATIQIPYEYYLKDDSIFLYRSYLGNFNLYYEGIIKVYNDSMKLSLLNIENNEIKAFHASKMKNKVYSKEIEKSAIKKGGYEEWLENYFIPRFYKRAENKHCIEKMDTGIFIDKKGFKEFPEAKEIDTNLLSW